jgi:hypothetical protein
MAVVTWCAAARASADSCAPDLSSQDVITKKRIEHWEQVLSSPARMRLSSTSDEVTFTAYVQRIDDTNYITIKVQKTEENLTRAAFESQYHAAKGDRISFGFTNGDPLSLVVVDVLNEAKAERMFLNMTAIWSAEVSDKHMATLKDILTTKQVDALRISSASGQIDRSVSVSNGKKLMEKFGCFYQTLDKRGIDLAATTAPGASQEFAQELNVVIEDILAQDKLTLQAVFQQDMVYLREHIADDALFFSAGKKLTKRMLLAQVSEQQRMGGPVRSRYSNTTSKTVGDVVEVTTTSTLSMQVQGNWRDFFEIRGTTKWRKVDSEWVILGTSNEYEKPLP